MTKGNFPKKKTSNNRFLSLLLSKYNDKLGQKILGVYVAGLGFLLNDLLSALAVLKYCKAICFLATLADISTSTDGPAILSNGPLTPVSGFFQYLQFILPS